MDKELDAIFLAGALPAAGEVIAQARMVGIPTSVPFVGGHGLDSPGLWQKAGEAAEGIFVSSLFDPKHPTRVTRDFVKRFETKFGIIPNTWEAQGYDAIQVVAAAIEKSGSTMPFAIPNNRILHSPFR